jgi:hypothetical protein
MGGTDGTGSLGIRGLRAASRPHRDCNLIYCVTVRSDVSLITEIETISFLLDIPGPRKQNEAEKIEALVLEKGGIHLREIPDLSPAEDKALVKVSK